MPFTLKKKDILRNPFLLQSLFLPKSSLKVEGFIQRNSIYVGPFKCVYMFRKVKDGEEHLQSLFAVPKRNFRRAVKRNLLRRRMKESYRQLKEELEKSAKECGIAVTIHLTYNSKELTEYNEIDSAIKKILTEIANKLACCVD